MGRAQRAVGLGGAMNGHPRTERVRDRLRWLLLGAAWVMFAASLPAPALHPGPGFFPDPMRVFLVLLVMWGIWPAFPLWIATACFAASPIFVHLAGRRRLGCVWPALILGTLGIWVYPAWLQYQSLWAPSGPASELPIGWGYYLWAGSYTLACAAALIPPFRRPRTDRRPGFPVVIEPPGQQQ